MKKEFKGNGKGKGPIVGYNHKKWNENFPDINWHNKWCAFCKLWTNHTEETCPQLDPRRISENEFVKEWKKQGLVPDDYGEFINEPRRKHK